MNDNNNGVKIEIEELEHNSEQFDENSENRELYNVKISSEGKEQSFTIKAQTVKIDELTFKRRKITITDNKNTSMTYFSNGKTKTNNRNDNIPMNLEKINDNDDINTIVDVLEHDKNIELKNKSINLCFKSDDRNTYKCDNYEKYKPYDYKIVNEAELKSVTNRLSEGMRAHFTNAMIGYAFDSFKEVTNDNSKVVGCCLDVFRNIKNIFK